MARLLLAAGLTCLMLLGVAAADNIIPKTQMTATASATAYGTPGITIDGSSTTGFWGPINSEYEWLRIDLGGRYSVERFDYQGRTDHTNGRVKDYVIYVTDVDSPYRASWGEPAAAGVFPNDALVHQITFDPKDGRYVILFAQSTQSGFMGATEVWIYGLPAADATRITKLIPGSPVTSGTVNVTFTAAAIAGATITGYMINQDPTPPDPGAGGWAASLTECTIADGTDEGEVFLYAWAKDTAGVVAGARMGLLYFTPEIQKVGNMTATASAGAAGNAIDGNLNTSWATGLYTNQWIRLDLKARYRSTALVYKGASGRILSYRIYATDVLSDAPSSWGEPVAYGTWTNDSLVHAVPFDVNADGRYIILYGATCPGNYSVGAAELWVFGESVPNPTLITQFSISAPTTNATVGLTLTASPGDGVTLAGYMITQSSTEPLVGDPGWQVDPPTQYIIADDTPDGMVTLYGWVKDSSGLVVGAQTSVDYHHAYIPKTQMKATASATAYGTPGITIDGSSNTGWWGPINSEYEWLRIDLGGRYSVERFNYQGRQDHSNGRIRDFKIYVTDVDSPYRASWGEPAAAGVFPNDTLVHKVDFAPVDGRYVILFAQSTPSGFAGATEVWAFGLPAPDATRITKLIPASPVTGGTATFTLEAEADELNIIDGLMMTQDEQPPAAADPRWTDVLTECTIADGTDEGEVFLYAWARDTAGVVAGARMSLLYFTPEIQKVGNMTATASAGTGAAGNAIDGNLNTSWSTGLPTNQWIRLDLKARYRSTALVHKGASGQNSGRILSYRIYATDVLSDDPSSWGEPVAYGTWTNDSLVHAVPFDVNADGRYIILYGATCPGNYSVGAAELWVFGEPVPDPTLITQFSINAPMTNGTVGLTLTASPGDGVTLGGYMITQSSLEPLVGDPGWQVDPPTQYIIADDTPEGMVTLYGWVKDSSGLVVGAQASVDYHPAYIPKTQMTATASVTVYGSPAITIDGSSNTGFWGPQNSEYEWLRIDLGGRYSVERFDYQGRVDMGHGRVKDYVIYVTDVDSPYRASWGESAATGTLPNDALVHQITFDPKDGRYVILFAQSTHAGYMGATEVWIYGLPAADVTRITKLIPASPITTGTVGVALEAAAVAGATIDGYMITQDATPPAAGDPGWLADAPTDFTIAAGTVEGQAGLYAWAKDSLGTVVGAPMSVLCFAPEIAKNTITATASTFAGGGYEAVRAIDGNRNNAWAASAAANQWIRLDLQSACTIDTIVYQGRIQEPYGRILQYQVYVTDDPGVLGDPVAEGAWPNDHLLHPLTFAEPPRGRYVVVYGVTSPALVGVGELWVFGSVVPTGPVVTGFSATDQSTGSELFTNSSTVNVSMTVEAVEGTTIDGYLITESDVEPTEGWMPDAPTTYTIIGGEGAVTLHAWAIDSSGTVGGATATIYYSTAAPVASNVAVTDNGDGTATATWTTDIPAEGSVKYGPVALSGATPNTALENALGTAHSVSFATAAGANYKIIVVNSEVASAPVYWPRPWPIDGDANMDCRVNILDLIFIRNKLNQPVGTGDNWKADVNEDTRINILDLIFVRNKLNTQCP